MIEKRVLDTSETMEYTGFKNRNKFFAHIKVGNLKPLPGYGKSHRFDIKDIDDFIDNLKVGKFISIEI